MAATLGGAARRVFATAPWLHVVTTERKRQYAAAMPRALRLMAGRDRDDAHLLALALTLSIPIWSNDADLAGLPVATYPTAVLLKILGA